MQLAHVVGEPDAEPHHGKAKRQMRWYTAACTLLFIDSAEDAELIAMIGHM